MDDNARNTVKPIQDLYEKALSNAVSNIFNHWKKVKKKLTKERIESLKQESHTLCGTAGSFGHPFVSQIARDLELYLSQLCDYRELNATHIREISDLVEKMTDFVKAEITPSQSTTLTYYNTAPDKIISYLSKHIGDFQTDLAEGVKNFDYKLVSHTNLKDFKQSLKQGIPALLLIEDDFFNEKNVKYFLALRQRYQIPFICAAQKEDMSTRLYASHAGVSLFLVKPIQINRLLNKIHQLCDLVNQNNFRVLVVDDVKDLAEYYALVLEESGMDVRTLNNPLHLIEVLRDFKPNLLLLDLYLPEYNGFDIALMIRQDESFASLPIIFISTEDDRIKQLAILNRVGADDFLTKPVLPQNLISAVKSRAQRAALLDFTITHDPLTNLLNHSSILQQLAFEILRAHRQHQTISIAMIDLDYFKKINDQYGHPAGDLVLMKISDLFTSRLRKTDFIGRYGGEEFILIFTDTLLEQAAKFCRDLCAEIASFTFEVSERTFSMSMSVGMANFPLFQTTQELVSAADEALYRAKENGRNRVELAT